MWVPDDLLFKVTYPTDVANPASLRCTHDTGEHVTDFASLREFAQVLVAHDEHTELRLRCRVRRRDHPKEYGSAERGDPGLSEGNFDGRLAHGWPSPLIR